MRPTTPPTTARCAWCRKPLPPSLFRPRVWCDDGCRRDFIRARRELADLEEQLVETRQRVAGGWSGVSPAHVAALERDVEAARARIPEEMR